MNPPKAIRYALTTHDRLSCDIPTSVPIDGRAMFTIDASSTTMNCAMQSSASAHQRRSR